MSIPTEKAQAVQKNRGRVYCVPMLGGDYAFGVVASGFSFSFSNVYDFVGSTSTPPADLAKRRFILWDLQGLDVGLQRKHFETQGPSWCWTRMIVEGVLPKQRFIGVGRMHPQRIDILGEMPNEQVSIGEVEKLPCNSTVFAPTLTARIEVAVKRLSMTPMELITKWQAGEYGNKDELFEATAKLAQRARRGMVAAQVLVQRECAGDFPTAEEYKKRQKMEEALSGSGLAELVGTGAGLGTMDIFLKVDKKTDLDAIRKLVDSVSTKRRWTVTVIEIDK